MALNWAQDNHTVSNDVKKLYQKLLVRKPKMIWRIEDLLEQDCSYQENGMSVASAFEGLRTSVCFWNDDFFEKKNDEKASKKN